MYHWPCMEGEHKNSYNEKMTTKCKCSPPVPAEPSCTSPGIRFPSVGKDGAWDGGRRRVLFSVSGTHLSASNEKKEKFHCSFLPNCAHCVFQTALI